MQWLIKAASDHFVVRYKQGYCITDSFNRQATLCSTLGDEDMEKTIVAFLLYAVHISSALDSNIQLVRENGEIKLTCLNTFSESLETETWYKNGRRLNFSPQEIPFTDGTLTFPDQVEYEAVYQCFGNSSANKNTSVRGKYC